MMMQCNYYYFLISHGLAISTSLLGTYGKDFDPILPNLSPLCYLLKLLPCIMLLNSKGGVKMCPFYLFTFPFLPHSLALDYVNSPHFCVILQLF